ncbi:MAG TPA: hypothetical protein VFU63_00345, partial [Ktedonobacterales bacterium]|nr:hypothetical protein [Ktedonobacterales bacterium]
RRWPSLPAWPPLPKNVPVVSGQMGEDTAEAPTISPGAAPYAGREAPIWDQPYRGVPDLPYEPPSTVWQRLRAAPRRLLIGLAAGAVAVVLLCSLLSVVVLGNAFSAFTSPGGSSVPGGITSGQSGLSTADATSSVTITPTATLSPATATPVSAFTVTFTCASGNIGGTGQVCIHTQPNAIVSLSVRYCDGSFAQGKSLRGTAHTDGNGDYTWRWNVTTHCAGTATATVMAKSNGLTLTQSTTFTVAR